MIKRSPSRNPRSKGVKIKRVLQICLLLGVCFWLIYQVKRSHDKKKEFDENDAKVSVRTEIFDEVLKLGRKDLNPHVQEVTKNEKHEEDEEEETGADEEVNKEEENKLEQEQREEETKHEEDERDDENKHVEEEQEEETKSEETEDEGRGGGDDELDESDQEKVEGEADHEEDVIDEETEREEEGGEQENESNEGEEKENHGDHETSSEDQDNDGGDHNTHGAREEHYKADDASSEVTHDDQIIVTEHERVSSENLKENLATNSSEQENNVNNSNTESFSGDHDNSTIELAKGVMDENAPPSNATSGEKNDNEITLPNNEDKLPKNTTFASLSNDQPVPSNKYNEAGNNSSGNTEISGTSKQNEVVPMSNSAQGQNATVAGATGGDISNLQTTKLEQVDNDTISDNRQLDSSPPIPDKSEKANMIGSDSSNSSSISDSDASERTIKPDATPGAEVNSGSSSTIKEVTEATHNENLSTDNASDRTDENLGSSTTKDPIDSSDSSIGQDEKDARMDLDTLPKNVIEGVNSRDAASE